MMETKMMVTAIINCHVVQSPTMPPDRRGGDAMDTTRDHTHLVYCSAYGQELMFGSGAQKNFAARWYSALSSLKKESLKVEWHLYEYACCIVTEILR